MKDEFEFTNPDKDIPLFAITNREQLLYLALGVIADDGDDDYKNIAASIVHWYIINELAQKQDTFTEDEVTDKFNELVINHILENLIKKGLVEENIPDEDGESTFSITEEGIKMFEQEFKK